GWGGGGPGGVGVPVYMPGRSRTASRPSRTVVSVALYVSRVAVTTLLQGIQGPGGTGRPACGEEDLHSCKSTGTEAVSQALRRLLARFRRSVVAFRFVGQADADPLL